EKTGKRVSARTIQRYRRELGYRPYHQQIKKSLTSTQDDEKIFTMSDVGTIVWCKPGKPRPIHSVDNIKAHEQLWGVIGWNFKAFSRDDGYMNSATYLHLPPTQVGPYTSKL
ncbi:unnamed protein product, partial [Rotaria sp. Silwood2]